MNNGKCERVYFKTLGWSNSLKRYKSIEAKKMFKFTRTNYHF